MISLFDFIFMINFLRILFKNLMKRNIKAMKLNSPLILTSLCVPEKNQFKFVEFSINLNNICSFSNTKMNAKPVNLTKLSTIFVVVVVKMMKRSRSRSSSTITKSTTGNKQIHVRDLRKRLSKRPKSATPSKRPQLTMETTTKRTKRNH